MDDKPKLNLYNTLSGKKEAFRPIADDAVRFYSCGPTVYLRSHIGNFRTYIFNDLLRRVLKRNGYTLKHVMNITDVGHLVSDEDYGEDKMIKGARAQNKTPWEIAENFTRLFFEDAAALNIETPEIVCKATEHIPQMLEIVNGLVDKGYAYELSDGIYFDISKFDGYGMLSRMNFDEQLSGARIEINKEKRHPADFALWIKAPKEHIMQWESPWGAGYPGWHIECSAMSMYYLGDRIDIHTGGVDHIPIHHENEIAQSDAYIGRRVVNAWMHGEFLLVDGGKMSKSLNNNYTIADLRDRGYNPLVFRYFCLNAHYRNKLNFTWDGLRAAVVSYKRFADGALQHKGAEATADVAGLRLAFDSAINDDLNVPKALGVAWQAIRNPIKSNDIFVLLLDMDEIFGFGLKNIADGAAENADAAGGTAHATSGTAHAVSGAANGANGPGDESTPQIPPEVLELVRERDAARAAKDWTKSDELRDAVKKMGYTLLDAKQGVKIEKIM